MRHYESVPVRICLPGNLSYWVADPSKRIEWQEVYEAWSFCETRTLREEMRGKLVKTFPTGNAKVDAEFSEWGPRISYRYTGGWLTGFQQSTGVMNTAQALYDTASEEEFVAVFLMAYARMVEDSARAECFGNVDDMSRASALMCEAILSACCAKTGFRLHHGTRDPFPAELDLIGLPRSVEEFCAQARATIASLIVGDHLVVGVPDWKGYRLYDDHEGMGAPKLRLEWVPDLKPLSPSQFSSPSEEC